jgi:hypothetical protein
MTAPPSSTYLLGVTDLHHAPRPLDEGVHAPQVPGPGFRDTQCAHLGRNDGEGAAVDGLPALSSQLLLDVPR